MKKLTSLLLIACLALSVLGVASVSAANDEVLKGTATIDGKVDEIYTQSLKIYYDGDPAKNATKQTWAGDTLTAYALYDDDYVYLVAQVTDDDVVSADKNWIMTNTNPYQNDVVEFRLNYTDAGTVAFKVGVDAYGYRAYTLQPTVCDITTVKYAATITDDGYIVEIAIPTVLVDKSDVIANGKLGLKIWLFDLQAASAGKVGPKDNQDIYHYSMVLGGEKDGGHGNPVYYALSDKEAKVETPTTPTTPDAPSTFDAGIVAAVVAVVSGAAVVVSKKRH